MGSAHGIRNDSMLVGPTSNPVQDGLFRLADQVSFGSQEGPRLLSPEGAVPVQGLSVLAVEFPVQSRARRRGFAPAGHHSLRHALPAVPRGSKAMATGPCREPHAQGTLAPCRPGRGDSHRTNGGRSSITCGPSRTILPSRGREPPRRPRRPRLRRRRVARTRPISPIPSAGPTRRRSTPVGQSTKPVVGVSRPGWAGNPAGTPGFHPLGLAAGAAEPEW